MDRGESQKCRESDRGNIFKCSEVTEGGGENTKRKGYEKGAIGDYMNMSNFID